MERGERWIRYLTRYLAFLSFGFPVDVAVVYMLLFLFQMLRD